MSKDDNNPGALRSDGDVDRISEVVSSLAMKLAAGTAISDDDWNELYVLHKGGAAIFSTLATSKSQIASEYRNYLRRASGDVLPSIVSRQPNVTPMINHSPRALFALFFGKSKSGRIENECVSPQTVTTSRGVSYSVAKVICLQADKLSLDLLVKEVDDKLALAGTPFQPRH